MTARRLLIPLDGSEMAESMLVRLSPLLRQGEVELTLLSAVDPRPEADFLAAAMVNELAHGVRRHLTRVAEKLQSAGHQVHTLVEIGHAAETILSVADKVDSSLICLSTHGRSGLERMLYGSVTEKVVRASTRPVLVVPSFDRTEPEGGVDRRDWHFRSIVVTLDGSPQALQIAPHVADITRAFQSTATLLVVLREGADEEHMSLAREHLASAAKLFEKAGARVETLIRNGDPATEILDYAPRYDHDMIMMTTHGRSGLSRWMLGSVAEKVVRRATVPVLVIRSTPNDSLA
jgi:nucleotide-binding universal stress UspA family protein